MGSGSTVWALDAAKTLAHYLNWEVSNLKMQKILYMAQLLHIGEKGIILIDAEFQAWKFGPVIPEVYHRLKKFGDSNIKESALQDNESLDGGPHGKFFKDVANTFASFRTYDLVRLTHHSKGAWAKKYAEGPSTPILEADIREEHDMLYRKGGLHESKENGDWSHALSE